MTWRTALSFIPWTEPERKERSGYDRPIFVVGMFMMINLGLAVGMMFAALFLLRPLLVRILSPGQRVALGWWAGSACTVRAFTACSAWSTSCPSPSVT